MVTTPDFPGYRTRLTGLLGVLLSIQPGFRRVAEFTVLASIPLFWDLLWGYNQEMRRLYLPDEPQGDLIPLFSADQVHRLRDVLRLKPGDEVETFDGHGNVYFSTIAELEKDHVLLRILSHRAVKAPRAKTLIGCAIPKSVKMDEIVDKLTQLGVDVIVPLNTARVVANLETNSEARLRRWLKISLAASEQSGRDFTPEVRKVTDLPDFLKMAADCAVKLIPTLEGRRSALADVSASARGRSIAVMIGPEGDFSPEEVELAAQAGFLPVSLGELVLRVDTAAVALAAYVHLLLRQDSSR